MGSGFQGSGFKALVGFRVEGLGVLAVFRVEFGKGRQLVAQRINIPEKSSVHNEVHDLLTTIRLRECPMGFFHL